MARSSSVPPLRGNPFWSDHAQAEHRLAEARPRDLPPVPDDGVWEDDAASSRATLRRQGDMLGMPDAAMSNQESRRRRSRSLQRVRNSNPDSGFKTPPSSWFGRQWVPAQPASSQEHAAKVQPKRSHKFDHSLATHPALSWKGKLKSECSTWFEKRTYVSR